MAVSLKSLCNCWFETSGASRVKSKTGPHTWRARKKQRKRQITTDWCAGGLISKGTHIQALSWAAAWQIDLHPCLSESWEFIQTLIGFSHIYTQIDSVTHCSLKAVWGWLPTVGTVCSIYSSSQGKGWRASDDPSPANGSTMMVTSSWWPPPTITLGKARQHWRFTIAEWVGEYGERGKETFRKDVSRMLLSKVASV